MPETDANMPSLNRGGEARLGKVTDAAGLSPDFRALFEASPTPFLVVTPPDFTIIAANHAYLRTTMTRHEEIIGRTLFEVFPDNPSDLAPAGVCGLRVSLERVLANRRPDAMAVQKYEIQRPEAEGGGFEECHWSLLNTPVLGPDGEVACIIHRSEDVTERKRIEEELRTSRQDLEDFFENSVAAMHWVAGDGTILRANQAELDLLGYTREEYVGRHVAEFHADSAILDDILERLSRGEVIDKYPARLRTKDGSIRYVVISSSVQFRDGEFVNTRCVTLDMTAERRAEALLRERDRQSRELLGALPVAVYTTDAAGQITYYNQAAVELWGRCPELGKDKWCGSWRLYWPDGKPMSHDQCPMAVALKENRAVNGKEAAAERPDGTRVPFLAFPMPLRDEAGALAGVVNTLVDITEHKQVEEALRESERHLRALSETLEQRVEARTAELSQQAARLRRLAGELTSAEQRERKRLAATLHDGLQQLLVAAKMRLRQTRAQIHDPAVRSAIEGVAEMLTQAVNSSRNLTQELRPPVLYEGGLLAALRWLASELLRLHELQVVVDAEDSEPPLSDDIKALLFEAVRELLFNVAKHAGVSEAAVRVHQDGRRLRTAVEDKGRGFDVEATAREEDLQQPGLGLFSIRERLAALGGDIAITSTPGEGSRIELTVPLAAVVGGQAAIQAARPLSPAAARPQMPSAAAADRQARVLVVDDHAIVREGVANVLSSDERLMVVGEAADGVEAIEAMERYQPDVVLIDVNMPRMNGVEATREIRRRWPGVRIVALSVQDDAATAKAMIGAGVVAFVSKSDDADQMIHAVLTPIAND